MALTKESCGLLYILLSAILFSIAGAFLKKTGQFGIPSTELVFFRAIFQGFFVVLGMLHFRVNVDDSSSTSAAPTGIHRRTSITYPLKKQNVSIARDGHTGIGEGDQIQDQSFISMIRSINRQIDSQKEEGLQGQTQETDMNENGELLIWVPFGRSGFEKKIVILRGIIGGGFGFICFFFSIKSLPLGDAITLFSLYPIYTIFLANVFLNEPITCRHTIIAVLSVIGGSLIAGPSFFIERDPDQVEDEQYNPLGYVTALVGGVFAASVFILIRRAGTLGVHTMQLLFSWCCFGILASIVFGMTFGRMVEGIWVRPVGCEALLLILATCAFGTAAHGLLNYAGRFVPAGQCAIVRSTDILWAYLLEVFMFNEVPTLTTIVGVVLISTSMVMVALEKVQEEKDKRGYDLLAKEAGATTKDLELT